MSETDLLQTQSFRRRSESMPTPKAAVEAISTLAGWYRRFKPNVRQLAINNRTKRRVMKMIEEGDRTFFSAPDGSLHYEDFTLFEHNE